MGLVAVAGFLDESPGAAEQRHELRRRLADRRTVQCGPEEGDGRPAVALPGFQLSHRKERGKIALVLIELMLERIFLPGDVLEQIAGARDREPRRVSAPPDHLLELAEGFARVTAAKCLDTASGELFKARLVHRLKG